MLELKVKDNTVVGFEIARDTRYRTPSTKQKPQKQDIEYYAEFIRTVWFHYNNQVNTQSYIGKFKNGKGLELYPDKWLRVAFTDLFCYKTVNGYTISDYWSRGVVNEDNFYMAAKALMSHKNLLVLQAELKREKEKYIKLKANG
jgi:hypothetical protein